MRPESSGGPSRLAIRTARVNVTTPACSTWMFPVSAVTESPARIVNAGTDVALSAARSTARAAPGSERRARRPARAAGPPRNAPAGRAPSGRRRPRRARARALPGHHAPVLYSAAPHPEHAAALDYGARVAQLH